MANGVEIENALNEIQMWFEDNPKLPQEINRTLLKRFFKCMYHDVEETKKLLEKNYEIRNNYPNLFINRDPLDNHVENIFSIADIIELPGLTPDRCKVTLYRLVDEDPRKADNFIETQIYFMLGDARFSVPDLGDDCGNDVLMENISDYEISVIDIKAYSLGHVRRFSISAIRAYSKYLQDAYPVRLKGIHIINCPPYLDKMITVVKPFISDAVYKLMHFHRGGLETLFEHVPREIMPAEYGGDAGTLTELKLRSKQLLRAKREYLMDPKQWEIKKTESRSRWFWF